MKDYEDISGQAAWYEVSKGREVPFEVAEKAKSHALGQNGWIPEIVEKLTPYGIRWVLSPTGKSEMELWKKINADVCDGLLNMEELFEKIPTYGLLLVKAHTNTKYRLSKLIEMLTDLKQTIDAKDET